MMDPEMAAALLAALAQHMPQFQGPGGAPMQPDPASGALLGPTAQGSVSPVPQGFGAGGFDGPVGENAQLGWAAPSSMLQYLPPQLPYGPQPHQRPTPPQRPTPDRRRKMAHAAAGRGIYS